MLPFLAEHFLNAVWGPFRLLQSHLILILIGACSCTLLTWLLLPRLWDHLPHDRGKNFVAGSEKAKGKPTGAGFITTLIFLVCIFFTMPFFAEYAIIGLCLFAIMMTGYLDDRSSADWGQLKKGLLDLAISAVAAWTVGYWQSQIAETPSPTLWLPFFKGSLPGGAFLVPMWLYVIVGTALLWIMINVVNCSDGVDGVAGSLALYGLVGMGVFLYGVMGHEGITSYLLLPHLENGASWATCIFTAAGGLCAYLWYNAQPSQVLMGDAGSRFYGLLLGLAVLVSGNPFMFLVAAPILFVNGGAGLIKLILLRTLKKLGYDTRPPLSITVKPIHPENFATDEEAAKQCLFVRFLHRYRFPVHDHCRKNLGWSDPQVLIRFMLLQTAIMPLVIILIIKLR
ncbi:MAG: hypothetical protein IKO65_01015 [Victivallales bacterium]|nr:hypothetical protein [Victivallales bacterium]